MYYDTWQIYKDILICKVIFLDFTAHEGYTCEGTDITSWDDGSNAPSGILGKYIYCEDECKKHPECAGFVQHRSSGLCDYWKRGPITVTQNFGEVCWIKNSSNNLYKIRP